jgi:ribonuclease BN (tRNA processing enzyme)
MNTAKSDISNSSKKTNKYKIKKSVFRHKKQTNLSSQDYLIPLHFVKPIRGDPLKIMSVAARGTTVLVNPKVCVDAGNLPIKLAEQVELLLITHGHNDHIQDIRNAFNDKNAKLLTVFCPASSAKDIFNMIKLMYQINKGRSYETKEILQHLQIYGVINPNDTTFELNKTNNILCSETNIPIVTLVNTGSVTEIELSDNSVYAIKPFQCHHTVDTVGYGIYTSKLQLNKKINISAGTVSEITPPKMSKDDKKEYKAIKAKIKANKKTDKKVNKNTESKSDEDDFMDHNLNRINFKTVNEFIKCLSLPSDIIKVSIVSREMENGFVLDSIRRIEFMKDIEIEVFKNNKCILNKEVFLFFKDYSLDMNNVEQINTHYKVLSPHSMVFGDTSATVFSQKLVKTMLCEFPRVIIESTFLDGEKELVSTSINNYSDNTETKTKVKNEKRNLYLRLKEKKHIFLPELYYYFGKYSDTEFVLMHFSDRYDKETVRDTIDKVRLKYPNVCGAI